VCRERGGRGGRGRERRARTKRGLEKYLQLIRRGKGEKRRRVFFI
jgi:hypothetical protein